MTRRRPALGGTAGRTAAAGRHAANPLRPVERAVMLLRLIVRGRARTFIQLPQRHRRGEHGQSMHGRKIIGIKRGITDAHVIKVANPTVISPARNRADQQRLVINSESVLPSFVSHLHAIRIDPDFFAIPDARDMMPFAIGEVGTTLHVIIRAAIGDAEGCLSIVQLQLVAAGTQTIHIAEIHVAGGLRRPNPRFKGESTLRIQSRIVFHSCPVPAVEPQRVCAQAARR